MSYHTAVSAVALCWVLRWQGVAGAIVGARSPEQIDGWIDAVKLELMQDDPAEIDKTIQIRAGTGPEHPILEEVR